MVFSHISGSDVRGSTRPWLPPKCTPALRGSEQVPPGPVQPLLPSTKRPTTHTNRSVPIALQMIAHGLPLRRACRKLSTSFGSRASVPLPGLRLLPDSPVGALGLGELPGEAARLRTPSRLPAEEAFFMSAQGLQACRCVVSVAVLLLLLSPCLEPALRLRGAPDHLGV